MPREKNEKPIDPQKKTERFNGKKVFDISKEELLVERLDNGIIRVNCKKYGEEKPPK